MNALVNNFKTLKNHTVSPIYNKEVDDKAR